LVCFCFLGNHEKKRGNEGRYILGRVGCHTVEKHVLVGMPDLGQEEGGSRKKKVKGGGGVTSPSSTRKGGKKSTKSITGPQSPWAPRGGGSRTLGGGKKKKNRSWSIKVLRG